MTKLKQRVLLGDLSADGKIKFVSQKQCKDTQIKTNSKTDVWKTNKETEGPIPNFRTGNGFDSKEVEKRK
jgi:hypothetical protein